MQTLAIRSGQPGSRLPIHRQRPRRAAGLLIALLDEQDEPLSPEVMAKGFTVVQGANVVLDFQSQVKAAPTLIC